MINWDELKHIHVIRKLEEILGSWFTTDIFFVDEKGHFRNWDPTEKRDFQNPLCSVLAGSKIGQERLLEVAQRATEKAFKLEGPTQTLDGILGPDRCLVSRIAVDNEFLGTVIAFPVLLNELLSADKAKAKEVAKKAELDMEDVEKALGRLTVVSGGDLDYFKQLVELVAQEIVTFHTEISRREERINALNKELGTRYRYDNTRNFSSILLQIKQKALAHL